MDDDVTTVGLSDQFDPTSAEYVQARLMELERLFTEAPDKLKAQRDRVIVLEEKHGSAKAQAELAAARDPELKNETARKAQVFIDTRAEREELQVQQTAYEYMRDKVHGFSREKDALQTRSANLRAEMQLAGKGQA